MMEKNTMEMGNTYIYSPLLMNILQKYPDYFRKHKYPKNTYLSDLNNTVYYVDSGVVKVYFYSEEKNKIFVQDFCFSGTAVIPYYSLISNADDEMVAETIKPCELYYIKKNKLLELYKVNPDFDRLKTEMLAYDYHRQLIRFQNQNFYTIAERYAKMLEVKHPITTLPSKEIAEYFEVSPQHFSNIKSKVYAELRANTKSKLSKKP